VVSNSKVARQMLDKFWKRAQLSDLWDERKLYLAVIPQISLFLFTMLEIMKRDHRRTMWKHSNKLSPVFVFPQDLYLYLFAYGYMWKRESKIPWITRVLLYKQNSFVFSFVFVFFCMLFPFSYLQGLEKSGRFEIVFMPEWPVLIQSFWEIFKF
jgi:hypothetical protein